MPDVERLLNAIDAAEENSYGSDSDGQLAKERAVAVDLYLGRNITPAPDGRSQVVDRSVYETVQWMMPSFSRIFANGDDVVELPPVGPEDEEGSKQEAQFLNHVLLQKNNWFEIFDTAAKDALLTKAGYLHPYIEKRRQIELEKYERQTPESVALIMQDQPEVVSQKEYPDPDYVEPPPQPMMQPGPDGQPMPVLDQMGQPIMQPPPPAPMLYDIEIRRTKVETHYCIKALPPERCKIAESTDTVQVSRSCPYFEYYDFPTISDLREMGYKVDDDIGDGETDDTEESQARDQYNEQGSEDINQNDPSMKRVKCRWVWIRHDYDEDGIAELQYVVRVGQTMLHREEVTRIPVAVLCPDKLPHRHVGLCPADIVSDVQQIKTAIIRQGLDNLYLSNNPVKYADPKFVNLDDMLVSRSGATVRLKPGAVFGQNFGVMPIPFVFPQAIEGLGYMDHVRETRTGVNNSFQGLDAGQLTQLQPGTVNQISSMAAQRTEQVARHFANGVTELMSILHELILKSGHKKEVVQLRGQWVTVDPSTWRKRTDFRISVGFAAGNKDAQITRLMMIGNMQKEAMAGGLSIVSEENVYETMNELIKAADMQAPQRFLTHPSKAPKKGPPQPDVTVMAMEQIKSQTTLQVKNAELETEKQVKAAEIEKDKALAQLDSQTKLTIEQMRAQHTAQLKEFDAHNAVGMKQLEGQQSAQLEEKRIQLKNQPAAELAGQVKELASQLGDAIESMRDALQTVLTAKRQIRRGKNGKAEGVDVIGPDGAVIASQSIQRDPDGRAVGTL
jgi:hypothetical protein